MDCIVAIDNGLTVTKAVVFGLDGRTLGVSRRTIAQKMSAPRKVERDMAELWGQTASAIKQALADSGVQASDVICVAATAHGDGVYLLDRQAKPLGNGILSLDSRAVDPVARWQRDGTAARCLSVTGQVPHVSAPSALLAWVKEQEPERYDRIGHILACKDWLRYCLTGTIGTDRTEASMSFTDVKTQTYSDAALDLFGLTDLAQALPQIQMSAEVVGSITTEAAAATGLKAGTPVAAGLHDVTASALGIGAHTKDILGIVAGTYSINEVVSDAPYLGEDWFCRNAIAPGQWNNMSISPASTTNYNWFIDTLCAADRVQAEATGQSIHTLLAPEIEAALLRSSSVLYHPYLFGSPMGAAPSAGFLGLRGWHDRGDMLAALLEGIVFNHRQHLDTLRDAFGASQARLTGGASRNPTVAQLFADVLGLPVIVTQTDEAAAWGAALCAGAAVGAFARFDADPRNFDTVSKTYEPDPARTDHYQTRYQTYREIAGNLDASWHRLNQLAEAPLGRHHD